jgi:hypothetical protein
MRAPARATGLRWPLMRLCRAWPGARSCEEAHQSKTMAPLNKSAATICGNLRLPQRASP